MESETPATEQQPLRITEGVAGTWFYHLGRGDMVALCGAKTMQSNAPLSSWGFVGHLRERYCAECARLATGQG